MDGNSWDVKCQNHAMYPHHVSQGESICHAENTFRWCMRQRKREREQYPVKAASWELVMVCVG